MQIAQYFTTILVNLTDWTGNLGIAIIVFTVVARIALLPLTIPSLKAGKKMRDVQPELKKLKQKHGKDKQSLQKAQLELYKKYNINPLAGCLPQLLQIGLLIVMYQALVSFLKMPVDESAMGGVQFLWFDLRHPDTLHILPVVAAVSQLFLSLMIAPGAEKEDLVPNTSKNKKIQEANKKEEDVADMAASMQQQMLFVMPVMTGIIALQFPAGLGVYWVVSTVFSIAQQYYISGWGGLVVYTTRAANWLRGTQKNQ